MQSVKKSNQSIDQSKRDLTSQDGKRVIGSQDGERKLGSKDSQRQSQFRISNVNSRKTLRCGDEEVVEKTVMGEGRLDEYGEEEEEVTCMRFPHLKFCPYNYQAQLSDCIFVEVRAGIFLSGFAIGLSTKFLLSKGVTTVLNVTSLEYTKRNKYFKYLNIDVHDTSDEDIKKHFRISNRFVRETLSNNGKVLIHCRDGINIGPCFLLAYMINEQKIPLKTGIEQLQSIIPIDLANHFQKQLEQYDLEKLALIQLKKQ